MEAEMMVEAKHAVFDNVPTNLIAQKIDQQLPHWRQRVKKLVTQHGNVKVGDVTIQQVYGGMHGINSLVTDISNVDTIEGIRMRGYAVQDLLHLLPKKDGAAYPLAGGLYYLLLVGELPTLEDALWVEEEWKKRRDLPRYVIDIIKALPSDIHSITMFSQAILALQHESVFACEYSNGLKKPDYWKPTLEDSLNLTAKLPAIAAYIYNLKYRDGQDVPLDPDLDWSTSFAQMIGKGDDPEYQELTRLFFILHADQETGNVSAHTSHLVGSALSDVYYSCSAGMNGLAGPLHGLANQECLRWLLKVRKEFNGNPTHEQLEQFAWDTLNNGKVIPGYGHAVLRSTDPRFTAQLEFGRKYMHDDELFQLVEMVYDVVPQVLSQLGKVKNPYPNVDAISGALQFHYGVRESTFYTVLFGVSRILGLTAHAVWARALTQPIERPKSLTTSMLEELAAGAEG